MMKLSVMRGFFELGQSREEHPIISAALEKWGYDKGTERFLRASNNFVIRFKKDGRDYILRLTDAGDKSSEEIQGELDFLLYLHEKGVAVNIPLKSLSDRYVEACDTEIGRLYAVVFNYFEGAIYDIDELDEDKFYMWGQALGTIHHFSAAYRGTGRESYLDHIDTIKKYLPDNEHFAKKELENMEKWLGSLEKTEDIYGLIHFDFELDNLIWDSRGVNIIDFDGCSCYWYAADFAFALRDLFNGRCDLSDKSFRAFLQGYRTMMEIDESSLENIQQFTRFHNLLTFTKLIRSLDVKACTLENSYGWLVNLINKLEGKVDEYRKTFEEYNK